jgi:hypothetical protein
MHLGVVLGAGQLWSDVAQCRLVPNSVVGRDDTAVASQFAHLRGRTLGAIELLLTRLEVKASHRQESAEARLGARSNPCTGTTVPYSAYRLLTVPTTVVGWLWMLFDSGFHRGAPGPNR